MLSQLAPRALATDSSLPTSLSPRGPSCRTPPHAHVGRGPCLPQCPLWAIPTPPATPVSHSPPLAPHHWALSPNLCPSLSSPKLASHSPHMVQSRGITPHSPDSGHSVWPPDGSARQINPFVRVWAAGLWRPPLAECCRPPPCPLPPCSTSRVLVTSQVWGYPRSILPLAWGSPPPPSSSPPGPPAAVLRWPPDGWKGVAEGRAPLASTPASAGHPSHLGAPRSPGQIPPEAPSAQIAAPLGWTRGAL